MSAPDIDAIEDRLEQLRAERTKTEQQLHAVEMQRAELDVALGRIDGTIQVLEEMLREQDPSDLEPGQ